MLLHQKKDSNQPHGFVGERIGRQGLELAIFQHEAIDFLAVRGVKGQKSPFRLGLGSAAKAVADGVAKIEEERRVLVVLAHEGFHPAQDSAVLIAKAVGDLALEAQGQDIA